MKQLGHTPFFLDIDFLNRWDQLTQDIHQVCNNIFFRNAACYGLREEKMTMLGFDSSVHFPLL